MTFLAVLTRNVFIAAVVGLVVALLLDWLTDLGNPYWAISVAIVVAAIYTPVSARSADRSAPGRR